MSWKEEDEEAELCAEGRQAADGGCSRSVHPGRLSCVGREHMQRDAICANVTGPRQLYVLFMDTHLCGENTKLLVG